MDETNGKALHASESDTLSEAFAGITDQMLWNGSPYGTRDMAELAYRRSLVQAQLAILGALHARIAA